MRRNHTTTRSSAETSGTKIQKKSGVIPIAEPKNRFTEQPFSEWLEEQIKELFDFEPQSIVLACITEEGTVATSNWNCDNFDLWKIIGELHEDIMDRYMEGREEDDE